MATEIRFGGLNIDHPGWAEKRNGATTQARLSLFVGKNGTARSIDLTEADLIRLIERAATALDVLRDQRERGRA